MKNSIKLLFGIATIITVVVACDNSAVARKSYDHITRAIARSNPDTSEPRQLARCAGVFMAAAASSQTDPEAEATFTKAGQYALRAAQDLSGSQSSTELSDLGYRTMVDYLTRVGIDDARGRTAIATEMESCIPLLDSVPTPEQRI